SFLHSSFHYACPPSISPFSFSEVPGNALAAHVLSGLKNACLGAVLVEPLPDNHPSNRSDPFYWQRTSDCIHGTSSVCGIDSPYHVRFTTSGPSICHGSAQASRWMSFCEQETRVLTDSRWSCARS